MASVDGDHVGVYGHALGLGLLRSDAMAGRAGQGNEWQVWMEIMWAFMGMTGQSREKRAGGMNE